MSRCRQDGSTETGAVACDSKAQPTFTDERFTHLTPAERVALLPGIHWPAKGAMRTAALHTAHS